MGLCLVFTNISIPLLEAEIFPLPSVLFPSCSRYLPVFSFSILETSCPAECLKKYLNDLGVGWGKTGQNDFTPATVILANAL